MSLSTEQLKDWIAQTTGIDAEFLNQSWFASLMQTRLQANGLSHNAVNYRHLLEQDPAELQRVVNEVTVPETWFFRYPASFDYLVRHLARLHQQAIRPPHLRMLSIACATGEEPASMVIAAHHAGWPLAQIRVDAVDREHQHLVHAQTNRFSKFSMRGTLPSWAKRPIQLDGDQFTVDPDFIARIRWKLADVTAQVDPLTQGYQVVFCRNLLVYLSATARDRLTARLTKHLVTDGLLFAGHADALELLRDRFEPLTAPGAFAFRSKTPAPVRRLRSDSAVQLPRRPRFRLATPPKNEPVIPEPDPTESPRAESPRAESLQDAIQLADEGQINRALAICESLEPSACPDLFALKGSILLAMDHCKEARIALRKSLYLDAANIDVLLQLAIVEERLGESAQAENYRRRAADIHKREGE